MLICQYYAENSPSAKYKHALVSFGFSPGEGEGFAIERSLEKFSQLALILRLVRPIVTIVLFLKIEDSEFKNSSSKFNKSYWTKYSYICLIWQIKNNKHTMKFIIYTCNTGQCWWGWGNLSL